MNNRWWFGENDYKTVWRLDFDAPENERTWEAIVSYMDDDIREALHAELAPCTNTEFLDKYLEEDPDFKDNIIKGEFRIGWDYLRINKSRI